MKVDWESRREERRAYIDRRVNRIVGEGAEGEEVGGARVGAEEALALERVVEGLGWAAKVEGDT